MTAASLWRRAIDVLRKLLQVTTVLLFGSYCCVILMQVFFRYVINSSLIWSEEVVRFEQFWVTMLATALCADRFAHIRLEGLEKAFPAEIRLRIEEAADLVTIIACAFLAWFGVSFVSRSVGTHSPAMQVSMDWAYMAMPIGAVLTIIFTLDAWARRARGERH
jgi:TRAP-type C4-dicarboxylate transport system permease small subunit